MKRNNEKRTFFLVIGLVILFLATPFLMMLLQEIIYEAEEEKYYKNVDNFMTEEAVVKNIIYNKEDKRLVLWLDEIHEDYQTGGFIIKGKNLNLVLERGILEKLEIGDEITFTSAPKYFGDGYMMPIVAISVNGEELLSFEEGHKNLMKMY